MTTTPLPRLRKSASSLTRSGNSSRHGTHQVAQKLTSTTLPFSRATRSWNCFASISPLMRGASAARAVAANPTVIPSAARNPFRVILRVSKGSLVAALLGMTRWRSDPLDRAAERLGLGLCYGLAREQRVEGVLEIRRGHLGGVVGILVDAPVVPQLAGLVDD